MKVRNSVEHVENMDQFDKLIKSEEGKVLIDFWAPWCGPCKMLNPILEDLADETTELTIAKVNVDEAQDLASEYAITAIPTLILFENGQPVKKLSGVSSKAALKEQFGLY